MKKSGKVSRKRICALASAILAGLSVLPSCALADGNVEVPVETLYHDGKKFAEISFFPKDVGLGSSAYWFSDPSKYTLSEKLQKATVSSAAYWSGILGDGAKNRDAWIIYVNTDTRQNAGAASTSIKSTGNEWNPQKHEQFVKDQIQEGRELLEIEQEYIDEHGNKLPAGEYGFSEITIGQYMGAKRTVGSGAAEYGWWVDTDTVLPTNEQAADFVGTFRHELGHALGISLVNGKKYIGGTEYQTIHPDMTSSKSWTLHLMDQTGKMAKPGMIIVPSDSIPSSVPESDAFIVDKDITPDGKGYAYFVGDNVTDVLDGATFFGRTALPVNGWERPQGHKGSPLWPVRRLAHGSTERIPVCWSRLAEP